MESLMVMSSAILWTIGRYYICTPAQWQAKHWFIKGLAITLALFPTVLFFHWDKLMTSAMISSKNQVIYCEISLRLFLIVIAIQGVMGVTFIVSSLKSRA
ncbi:hypothetical protein L4D09_10925 [Photobacterium makurazakiensis]|uniref:hypothetical protein n=1 Tax=Photobacterium makurazakiensis TaxID=2910234 RepID=UPI003D0F7F5C